MVGRANAHAIAALAFVVIRASLGRSRTNKNPGLLRIALYTNPTLNTLPLGPPPPPLVKKLLLAPLLIVLAIIAWRFVHAPADPTVTDNAKTGDRPERREPRGTHQITQRDFSDPFKTPDRLKLVAETLDSHLAQQQRSAQSLLAAYQISGDIALLREAAERFPDEPSVQLEMAMKGESPEERRKALDALRASDPENALADCLAALQHLKEDDLESAFKDLTTAAGKPEWDSYDDSKIQGAEDAYLAAGSSPAEAKVAAVFGLPLGHVVSLNGLSSQLSELQNHYAQSGDAEAAESVRQMGQQLGKRMQAGVTNFISEMTGMAIEQRFSDPATSAGRIAEMRQRLDEIRELSSNVEPRLSNISDTEAILYTERIKYEGEEAATNWLLNRQ